MPEGPEVKIITNWLSAYATGWKILDCADVYKKKTGYASLKGCIIDKVTCKGKQIFFHLKSPTGVMTYINNRLAMEGKWTSTEEAHMRFWFKLKMNTEGTGGTEGAEDSKMLYFCDTRNFGGLDLLSQNGYLDKLSKIGPDLLSGDVTLDEYKSKITYSRIKGKQVCDFLMEQKYFSGIGNYLKAEILYICKIRPDRVLSSLHPVDILNLYNISLYIIKESYSHGGLTIKSFWSPEGKKGMYPCRVYNLSTDQYGNPVVKETYDDDRNTHWVPAIQV